MSPASTLSTDPVQTEQHSEPKDFDLKDLKGHIKQFVLNVRQTLITF